MKLTVFYFERDSPRPPANPSLMVDTIDINVGAHTATSPPRRAYTEEIKRRIAWGRSEDIGPFSDQEMQRAADGIELVIAVEGDPKTVMDWRDA